MTTIKDEMTTIKVDLPKRLASEAKSAGLLEPERIAMVLEEALRKDVIEEFRSYSEKFRASGVAPLTEEEVMAEVKAAREERKRRRQ